MARSVYVRRTLSVVQNIPFDEEHYPGMTFEEALAHERDMSWQDKVVAFCDKLDDLTEEPDMGESIMEGEIIIGLSEEDEAAK